MSRDRGSLALLLHSHMPYVEGFGTWPFGEEWLWEAVASVYLPLIELLGEAQAPLTLGVTPVLADQLETLPGPAGDRLAGFLAGPRAEVHERDSRGLEETGQPELAAEVRRAAGDHEWAARRLGEDRDLVGALARLERDTPVELWTSSATHALLPLLASDAGVRLQLAAGTASHERRFGGFGGGLWLPECAYVPGLERELADVGVTVTCVDQTSVHGFGAPEQLEPVLTAAGVVAVPIDWQTVQLVWNGLTGYPATACYRDYHHRTTHDLRPWNIGGGPYRPADAAEQAQRARARLRGPLHRAPGRLRGGPRAARAAVLRPGHRAAGPLVVRGPAVAAGGAGRGGRAGPRADHRVARERAAPSRSSVSSAPPAGGPSKDFSTWDSPKVADAAFTARTRRAAHGGGRRGRRRGPAALGRAARELMALQASDWAFQITGDLSADYPAERLAGHAAELDAALESLRDSAVVPPDPALRNLAPDLDLAPLVAP